MPQWGVSPEQQAWWQHFQQVEAAQRQATLQRLAQLSPAGAAPWHPFGNAAGFLGMQGSPLLQPTDPQAAQNALMSQVMGQGAPGSGGSLDNPQLWQMMMGG